MSDLLVTFQTAKLAKEKGFKEEVRNYFKIGAMSKNLIEEDCISTDINLNFSDRSLWARPTQTFLQKWLREQHKLHVYAVRDEDYWTYAVCEFAHGNKEANGRARYESFEEALEEGLKCCLEYEIDKKR